MHISKIYIFQGEILGTVKRSSQCLKTIRRPSIFFKHLKMTTSNETYHFSNKTCLLLLLFLKHSYFTRRLRFIILIEKVKEWKLLGI